MIDAENYKYNTSSDIQLVLRPIDGKPLAGNGLVDKGLFTGENTLHVIMDLATCLWYFKYERGIVPQPLKQRFTSYSKALVFATEYFGRRNIQITEVKDKVKE